MKALRVCLLGAGRMGQLHARTVARAMEHGGGCLLVGVIDHHLGRAASLAREFGGEIATTWEKLIDRVDADVGIVAVPTVDHAELGLQLLAHGLDLLVEKPLAASVAEGERLLEQAHGHGRILQVGHVEWYDQTWREAARRAGRLRRIEVERTSPRGERGLDIDVVQDLMLHDLDWITRWVGEEIVELRVTDGTRVGDRLDAVDVRLGFRSGIRAQLRASRLGSERRRTARFEGAAGTATADLIARTVESSRAGGGDSGGLLRIDPLEAQWRDFVAAVQSRQPPINDGAVGLAALRLVARVQEAARADRRETRRDDDSRLGR